MGSWLETELLRTGKSALATPVTLMFKAFVNKGYPPKHVPLVSALLGSTLTSKPSNVA